jgi:polysaccharide biosynthesis/export protein
MGSFILRKGEHALLGCAVKKLSAILTILIPAIFCCVAAYPQNPPQAQTSASELAKQNMDRVAASAAQIETVLHNDAGLMVELKRWVAKDATNHGQLISDSDLTDQAIYDRLETDVQFRSVATLLLQKYGYLLPKVNPDSPAGKEQELLIQDRAKWLAQDQEEQLTQARQQASQNMLQARGCDPQMDPNCPAQQRMYPAGQQSEGIAAPNVAPGNLPPTEQTIPATPQRTLPRLEQARLMQNGAGNSLSGQELPELQGDSYAALAALTGGIAGPGTLVPSSLSSDASGQDFQAPTSPQAMLQGPGAVNGLSAVNGSVYPQSAAATYEGSLPESNGPGAPGGVSSAAYQPTPYSSVQPISRRLGEETALSQRMVQQVNPFTDIPSLYDMYLQASPQPPAPERFGMQVFENGTRNSQIIPFDLPVGPDYVVGPGDSLAIDLWGGVSERLLRTVDPEGRVSLPEAGPLLVAGKSLADVQTSVQKTLRTQFRNVSADVSLARLRTIRVYVVGDVEHPGAYDISSLSTPLNALFVAGGPTSQGSLRILDHNRGNQTVQAVDVYDLLLKGVKTDIQRLENGDTVLVPPIGPEVTVEGMVRRPAIYELRNEKTLSDVLALAGGLLPTATLRHIEVQRVVAHEKRTMLSLDIPQDDGSAQIQQQLDSFQVQDGDKIRIFPIAPYNTDTVYLEGHVLRPGKYSYHEGMRVTDLISSYKELLPEPASQYAEIIRLNAPDYRPTVESFNLKDALAHPATAPILQPLDTVQIFGRYDFENPPTVSVWGDVRVPGTYRTSGQIHLSDAIHMVGGLAPDAETEDAQVFRYLPDGKLKIFSVKLSEAIAGNPDDNILLDSRDRILVHRNPADVDPATVYIRGEVARPGLYPLTTNMTVADLIRAAGGFKRSADTGTADLIRYVVHNQKQLVGEHEEVNLATALSGAAGQNIPMIDGDVLTIRQIPGWNDIGASVILKGEVKHPGTYGIRPGERLSSVLERAGGFLPTAYPPGAVLESVSVRDLQQKSRDQLIEEIQRDSANYKVDINASAQDRAQLQQASMQQHQQEIQTLEQAPVTGRVVVRIPSDLKHFRNSPDDVELRDGDSLFIPKRPDFVLVTGQVYNTNAITYIPGRNAAWYLNQAGGATNLANKGAIFIIRADGGVVSGRGQGWWTGNVLSTRIEPGDTIVVPEKPVGGSTTWKNLLSVAQIAQAAALSAFVFTH